MRVVLTMEEPQFEDLIQKAVEAALAYEQFPENAEIEVIFASSTFIR